MDTIKNITRRAVNFPWWRNKQHLESGTSSLSDKEDNSESSIPYYSSIKTPRRTKSGINILLLRHASLGRSWFAMHEDEHLLVYHYRANGEPVVANALAVLTHKEFEGLLRSNPRLQFSRKQIPRGVMSVDIYQRDLLTPSQAKSYPPLPNDRQNVASVQMPLNVWFANTFTGKYAELYILSEKDFEARHTTSSNGGAENGHVV